MGYVADSKQNPLVEVHKRVCLAFLSGKIYFDYTCLIFMIVFYFFLWTERHPEQYLTSFSLFASNQAQLSCSLSFILSFQYPCLRKPWDIATIQIKSGRSK